MLTEQNRTEQNRTEQNRTEQNRTEQNRTEQNRTEQNRTERNLIYLEAMRVIACFFVIFNHTGAKGFFLFSTKTWGSAPYWIYSFVSIFCKFAVPLFFAISGALLLTKCEEPLRKLFSKRILRIFMALLLFSVFYYGVDVYSGKQILGVNSLNIFFKEFFTKGWVFAYWYLYAYLVFLLTLPFLRLLCQKLENKHFYYLFALVLFFRGVLPAVQYLLWQDKAFFNGNWLNVWFKADIFVYPLLGYFLERRCELKKVVKALPWLLLADIFCICLSCLMTYYKVCVTGKCAEGVSQAFHSSFALLNCATVYLFIKYSLLQFRLPLYLKRALQSVGGCTFGIYLLHIFFLGKVKAVTHLWGLFREQWHLNYMLSAFIYCLVVMFLSYLATLMLKLVPVMKKLL